MPYALVLLTWSFFSFLPHNTGQTCVTENTQQDPVEEVKMEIRGLYEHRNLFVSNPVLENGKRCITRAPELNGIPTAKVTDANALEIKLSEYELELGDVIKITVWHSPECKPVVINPEVIDPAN